MAQGAATLTLTDAPQPPKMIKMTLRQKSLWESFKEKCKDLTPAKMMEVFNSEKDRIMKEVKKRGSITEEEREFLNKKLKERVTKILDEFKEKAMEQMEIQPNDTPEEIEFKLSFGEKLLRWLSDLFSWVIEKMKEIFRWIKEKLQWCIEKAKELFEYLWSFFT